MAHYQLDLHCWPAGSFRERELAELLSLVKTACGVSAFQLDGGATLVPTPQALADILRAALAKAPDAGAGANVDIFGQLGSSDKYVACEIHAGTQPGEPFIDQYNVDFGRDGLTVGVDEFKRMVCAIRPFEAFLAEATNEYDLDAYTRVQQLGFTAPAIIRGLHYFDRKLAAPLGGVDHCLTSPASRAEPFLDGVFIQLVDEPFDPAKPEHLKRQQDVMRHLGIAVSALGSDVGQPGTLKT